MTHDVNCLDCKHVFVRNVAAVPDDLGDCPMCGSTLKNITVKAEDSLAISDDDVDITARTPDGELVIEHTARGVGATKSYIATDLGGPSKLIANRGQRVGGFEEESLVADALVKAYNASQGAEYAVEQKTKEDSDYADRVLVSNGNTPKRIPVQIRHFDDELIAELGKTLEFVGNREVSELAEKIDRSIEIKSKVDAKQKASTILLSKSLCQSEICLDVSYRERHLIYADLYKYGLLL